MRRKLPAYFFNLLKYRRLTLEKLAFPADLAVGGME